ncbi:MAG TPA: hypothetical protein DCL76_05380 [Chloroflexi bacterium]|nr:hypothetical protein [Chloroflexota bacterium]HCU99412.1 hypothetical protein [Chloroflexota bacterium]|tara:strand:+ start:7117 stop:7836 length:720 start_codon:yes stop_codon:yes gene_type:complete
MKDNTNLSLNEAGSNKNKTVIYLLILCVLIGGGIYAWQSQPNNTWSSLNLFSTPTYTPEFTPTAIKPTSTLFVPSETNTVTPTATRSGPVSYIIEEGDTLYDIALQYEIDVQSLIDFNASENIDLTKFLQVNQEILIPPSSFVSPTLTPIPYDELEPGSFIEHTIKPGDILQLLAKDFNTTVDSILEENADLAENPNILNVGQTIRIPVDIIALTPSTPTRQPSNTPTIEPSTTTSSTN